ncbi:MAG TPA: ribosome maturation factor RimM [Blastocatellia bacterium]|nr:ribosome maturation factor RimM [Blastocatellia bacterium]
MSGPRKKLVGGESLAKDEQSENIEDLISIAVIARPHGVRGEVTAEVLTDFPERFDELETVKVVKNGALIGELELEHFRFHKDRVLLKFAGYDTPEEADKLRDARLVISRDELIELPEDTYYEFDLKGCEVETIDGERVGQVIGVNDYGASPLLVVKDETKQYLIPLTHNICTEVDIEGKRIRIAPPEGLLEL